MKKIIFGLFLLVLCIGCSKRHSTNIPKQIQSLKNLTVYSLSDQHPDTLRLQRQQTFGNSDNEPIGYLGDIAVDTTGHVFIADTKQRNIKVYNPDGLYIKSLGRKGKGPGEFTNIADIQAEGSQLFAQDNNQQKVVIFSVDSLAFDHAVKLAPNRSDFNAIREAYPGSYLISSEGGYFMKFYKNSYPDGKGKWKKAIQTGYYYFLDRKGKISSRNVFDHKSAIRVFVPLPNYMVDRPTGLYGKSIIRLAKKNRIYVVPWSDHFLVKVYSPGGTYQRAFYYPYKNVPLTHKSASEAGIPKFILKGFQSMDLPETWPALHNMLMDDQHRLWISTIVKNQKGYQWWVLNDQGKLLARFRWPRAKSIEEIKNGYLYTKETDKKTGIQQIVRYTIAMQ